jgi:hypothetical protein
MRWLAETCLGDLSRATGPEHRDSRRHSGDSTTAGGRSAELDGMLQLVGLGNVRGGSSSSGRR